MNASQVSQSLSDQELHAVLNAQTGSIAWQELESRISGGAVIRVAAELDLVAVAAAVVRDDRDAVAAWLDRGQVQPADADTCADWRARDARLWAVVTAPWVLVQERAP